MSQQAVLQLLGIRSPEGYCEHLPLWAPTSLLCLPCSLKLLLPTHIHAFYVSQADGNPQLHTLCNKQGQRRTLSLLCAQPGRGPIDILQHITSP